MRIVLIALFVIWFGTELLAATYEKVSDSVVKEIATTETETSMTLAQIDRELSGINGDLTNIENQYLAKRAELLQKKLRYDTMKTEAAKLGVK